MEPRDAASTGTCSSSRLTPACRRSCATSTVPTATSPRCGSSTASPPGFRWLEVNDAAANVIVFARLSREARRVLVCACNLAPVPRHGYRVGLPRDGRWVEALNTDDERYGGSGFGNPNGAAAEATPWHEQPFSAAIDLPPLGVVWLVPSGVGLDGAAGSERVGFAGAGAGMRAQEDE